jgi:hypothetical protein
VGLLSYFRDRKAFKHFTSTPYRQAVSTAISMKVNETGLKDHWSEEAVGRLAEWLWDTAMQIEASPNPILACREALVDQGIARANYMTLLFEPNPDGDPSGFTGTQGITGKLHSHIDEIARKDEHLLPFFDVPPDQIDWQSANDAAVTLMWKFYWTSEVFNTCRVALGDYVEGGENWFKTFLHAMCVFREHQCREMLCWPSAIEDDDMGMIPLAYHTMMEFALSDTPYPARAWRNHYADWIAEGRLKPPFGND